MTQGQWYKAYGVFMSITAEQARTKQEAVTLINQMITYRRTIYELASRD